MFIPFHRKNVFPCVYPKIVSSVNSQIWSRTGQSVSKDVPLWCREGGKGALWEQPPVVHVVSCTAAEVTFFFVCLFVFGFLGFFFCLFAISWAAPKAYGGSQAKGPIGAVATGLCQSHSNTGS